MTNVFGLIKIVNGSLVITANKRCFVEHGAIGCCVAGVALVLLGVILKWYWAS